MDWQSWAKAVGMHAPISSDLISLAVAVLLAVLAYGIGWWVSCRVSHPALAHIRRLGGHVEGLTPDRLAAIIRYGLAALLLLIIARLSDLGEFGPLVFALALGAAIGLLTYRVAAAFGAGPAFATILALVGLVTGAASQLGGLIPLADMLDGIGFSVGKRRFSLLALVNGIAIIAFLFMLVRVANRLATQSIARAAGLDASQRVLAEKLVGIVITLVAILMGVDMLDIDLTALTVFSGALGLAVGIGLQKTFGNLIAGLILLMDRSIKPGDVIVVGDTFGAVNKIGIRAVSVVTRDGKEHLIPNEQLMTEAVENWSYSSRDVRVHIPVGVSYGSDLALAQRLMIEAATAAARVLPEPRPSVWLKDFGDSSVDHDILVWISDPEQGVGNVRSDILNRIWKSFAEHGVEIPFPQRDVHIRSMPPGKAGVVGAKGDGGDASAHE